MIRLVSGSRPSLSLDAARATANSAYSAARAAQRKLIGHLDLIELLYRPGPVSYYRLKGELTLAEEQVQAAQAVAEALAEAMAALEAGP
jgi:hypothetical protein